MSRFVLEARESKEEFVLGVGVYAEPGIIVSVLDGMLEIEFENRPFVRIVDQEGESYAGMKVHSRLDKGKVGNTRRNQDLRSNPQLGKVYRFAVPGTENGIQALFGVNLNPGDLVRRRRRVGVIGKVVIEETREDGHGI